MTSERPTSTGLLALLRCIECSSDSELRHETDADGKRVVCGSCGAVYPIVGDVPRMMPRRLRATGSGTLALDEADLAKQRTAQSFGFEWRRFPRLLPEWRQNFLAYMRPHGPEFFRGKTVLDAGSGMGRHAYHAALFGADVVALDIGPAIDVTRENTAALGNVLAVQADLDAPPLRPGSFDMVYSIGVIHHLPDPLAGLRALVRSAKPGAEVRMYVYSDLRESRLKRALLPLVNAVRAVTVRLPHWLLYVLSYPIALAGTVLFIWPARFLRLFPSTRGVAMSLPLAAYADYPFGVCVNDQFDRFSAPIERRYGREEVRALLAAAGLTGIEVRWHYGWIGTGVRPLA